MEGTGVEYLISLLERKNLCFRSFHKLCADFIDEIAIGDTTNLDTFQRRRQGLIKVLEQLEFEVVHWLEGFKSNEIALESVMFPDSKQKINQLLREKDGIVTSILDLDLQILSHIDRIKDDTIQKLQSVQNGRKTINAYRPSNDLIEGSSEMKIVDQEA